jgi:hypothetical protein
VEYYKKLFKKLMDYYEPEKDEFLVTELAFKQLFKLRDELAYRLDLHPDMVAELKDCLTLARVRPLSQKALD